jgi:hypothetical protein
MSAVWLSVTDGRGNDVGKQWAIGGSFEVQGSLLVFTGKFSDSDSSLNVASSYLFISIMVEAAANLSNEQVCA